MYTCPYLMSNPYIYRVEPGISFGRLLHASPDAPPVDVYLNNKSIGKNIRYREFTQYLPLVSGNYNLKIYPTGNTTSPLINLDLDVPLSKIFTVAVAGLAANVSLLSIPEPAVPMIPGKTYIRFIHLSPNAPNVNVKLPTGSTLFQDVEFKEYTNYTPINPGNYTFLVTPTTINTPILAVPNIRLRPNKFYSIYVVGLVNEKPPLQALIPLDGNTYIKV